MTFINHGIGGAVLYIAIARIIGALAGINRRAMSVALGVCGVLGFVLGCAPDVLHWASSILNLPQDGIIQKAQTHSGPLNTVMSWTLAWGLHTYLDKFIHPPLLPLACSHHDMIWMAWEISAWVAYAGALWLVFRWANRWERNRRLSRLDRKL